MEKRPSAGSRMAVCRSGVSSLTRLAGQSSGSGIQAAFQGVLWLTCPIKEGAASLFRGRGAVLCFSSFPACVVIVSDGFDTR